MTKLVAWFARRLVRALLFSLVLVSPVQSSFFRLKIQTVSATSPSYSFLVTDIVLFSSRKLLALTSFFSSSQTHDRGMKGSNRERKVVPHQRSIVVEGPFAKLLPVLTNIKFQRAVTGSQTRQTHSIWNAGFSGLFFGNASSSCYKTRSVTRKFEFFTSSSVEEQKRIQGYPSFLVTDLVLYWFWKLLMLTSFLSQIDKSKLIFQMKAKNDRSLKSSPSDANFEK